MNPCCQWEVIETDGLPPVHIVPGGDTGQHDLSEDCVCRPRLQATVRANGADVWVALHHSLDRDVRSAAA